MEWLTAEHIGQFAVLLLAVGTLAKQHFDGRRTAKKDEIERLQNRITLLETKLSRETMRVVMLMEYIGTLQMLMREGGLKVPDMPTIDGDDEPEEERKPKVKARK